MRTLLSIFAASVALSLGAEAAFGCEAINGTFVTRGEETDVNMRETKTISMNDRLAEKGLQGAAFRFAVSGESDGYTITLVDSAGTELHRAGSDRPAFHCKNNRLSRRVQFEGTGDGNPTRNDFELSIYIESEHLVFESRRIIESVRWIAPEPTRLVHTITRYQRANAK